MKKDELRPCKVTIEKTVGLLEKIEKEERSAYFHIWHVKKIGSCNLLLAVVEYENGSVCLVKPEQITFSDRSEDN